MGFIELMFNIGVVIAVVVVIFTVVMKVIDALFD